MKLLFLGLSALLLVGCGTNEFCGIKTSNRDIQVYESLDKGIQDNGSTTSLTMNLLTKITKEIGEESQISVGLNHSTRDTIALEITNIPSEEIAKQVSCIVADDGGMNSVGSAYVLLDWGTGTWLMVR